MRKKAEQATGGWSRRRILGLAAKSSLAAAGLALAPPRLLPAAEDRPGRVPYYSSRSDLDAGVACARMVLNFFNHDEHYEYTDVSEMIYHREGRWVFEAQLLPILMKKGYRAGLHASTPYPDLAAGRGLDRYGAEGRDRIDQPALAWAAGYLSDQNFLLEETDGDHLLDWLKEGEILVVSVHRGVLRRDPALPYCRYQVILTGRDRDTIRYHDPSLGPHCRAPVSLLLQAFTAAPTDHAVLRVLT